MSNFLRTGATPQRASLDAERGLARQPRWQVIYRLSLLVVDAVGVLVGSVVAYLVSRPGRSTIVSSSIRLPYAFVSLLVMALWLLTLTSCRVYTSRVLGAGNDEYRRVLNAIIRLVAGLGTLAFFAHVGLSRSYLGTLIPFALVSTLLSHWAARQYLHWGRRSGRWQTETLVVGSPAHAEILVAHLRQFPYVGLEIVGACTGTLDDVLVVGDQGVPVVAAPADLVTWIRASGVRAVVIADATVLGPGALRQFAWRLEGLGVDLMVAPSMTGVAGPRISVRPVEGLPLLHLEEPRFDGVTRLVKGLGERSLALLLLLLFSPVLLLTALLVRLTSRGPIFYRHIRVGKGGVAFQMLKFRTMVDGADQMRHSLANEHGDDPLFKLKADPRITAVGRWMRRLSLDELPQFLHVVTGKMAIVGPRPPLPDEVARYTDDAWRRLMVRPGITGLWQVSGRSSLPWLETLRLDLYYVDNWSLALDLVIVLKTFNAVVRGSGAY